MRTVTTMLQKLRNIPETADREEEIRNLACDILACADETERYTALNECRCKIRKIENDKCRKLKKCDMVSLDIGKLIENITVCADVLLCEAGKSLTYTLERQTVSCCPMLIIDAFLNLLSNSVKYSSDSQISISLFSKGDNEFIIVENNGALEYGSLLNKGGIAAAASCARLHCGRLLYSTSGGRVRAGMSICSNIKSDKSYDVPDYSSFLTDEFSPVYIGLADVCSL